MISLFLYFGNINGRGAFILPMLLPTAAISVIFREIFKNAVTALPVYLLFWWKNTGICIILLTASFAAMDREVFEAAAIDGAGNIKKHIYITIPMNIPVIIFTTLLSIVNSFRIFKESCLFYGSNYPPDCSYTLQYYMNNHFYKLDYQVLSSSAVLLSVFIMLIVAFCFKLQKKYQF
ncbi:MAG: ABC transporter permease subunit [Lachnospiraceae bacterium]|nr:ABC transporter permease subunit [Lachnospiraceae bacterium]